MVQENSNCGALNEPQALTIRHVCAELKATVH